VLLSAAPISALLGGTIFPGGWVQINQPLSCSVAWNAAMVTGSGTIYILEWQA
jgi:hypothetical protein